MPKQRDRPLPRPPALSGRAQLKLVEENRTEGSEQAGASPPLTHTTPSAVFRPGLIYDVEPFAAIARELPRLIEVNWKEIESDGFGLQLDPDWDFLYDMSQAGRLHIMTARYRASDKRPGMLVGYIFNLVYPHIYSRKSLSGELHLYYLHPSYRDDTGFIIEWFKANDEFLVSLGCKKLMAAAKLTFKGGRTGLIFRRLGYTPVETMWARMV